MLLGPKALAEGGYYAPRFSMLLYLALNAAAAVAGFAPLLAAAQRLDSARGHVTGVGCARCTEPRTPRPYP